MEIKLVLVASSFPRIHVFHICYGLAPLASSTYLSIRSIVRSHAGPFPPIGAIDDARCFTQANKVNRNKNSLCDRAFRLFLETRRLQPGVSLNPSAQTNQRHYCFSFLYLFLLRSVSRLLPSDSIRFDSISVTNSKKTPRCSAATVRPLSGATKCRGRRIYRPW